MTDREKKQREILETLYCSDCARESCLFCGVKSKDDNIDQALAELAKLDAIPTAKEVDFEQFLSEQHAEQYCGSKSSMVDDCADWITDLSPDEFIEYANLYAKTFQTVKPKEEVGDKQFKLEYNKKLRTICIRFKDKLFYPQVCYHNTLHIEGKYLKFLVCNSCGEKWERCREYSKNTSYTFFRRI